jgi:uncharacterized integral membrane protein
MSRNVLIALVLMILSVLVMIFNHSTVSVDLLFMTVKPYASLAYLSFTVVGVVIGVLLK